MHRLRPALRRARRILGRIAVVFGLALVLVGVLLTAALLYLDTAPGRVWLRDRLNDTLAPVFAGSLVIEEIAHVGFTGLHGVRATVRDPEGVQVIHVEGADFGLPVLARALAVITGDHRIDVTVDDVEIDYADVSLDASPSGALRIAEAFALRPSAASDEPAEPAPPVYVHVLRARVRHGWLHGRMHGYWIDADIDDVDGAVAVTPGTVSVSVARASVNRRGAPRGANFTGRLEGELSLPDDDMWLDVGVAGHVAGIPVAADCELHNEQFAGAVDIGPASGEVLMRLFPFLQPRGSFVARGRLSGTLQSLDLELEGEVAEGALVTAWAHVRPAPFELEGAFHVERVNLAVLDRRAPTSRLDADASVWTEGDAIAFQLTLAPSTLMNKTLPTARLRGALDDEWLSVSGSVGTARERGSVAFDADLRDKRGHARVRAERVDLGQWLDASVRGTARVDADVEVGWARSPPAVGGRLSATVDRLSVAGVSVARGYLDVSARSLWAAPSIDLRARAQGVAAGRIVVDQLEARAVGALDALRTRVAADIRGRDLVASGRVRIDHGIAVDDLEVSGLGAPMHGSLAFAGERFEVALHTKELDLGTVAGMAGLEQIGGTASLDLHAVRDARGTRGTLVAELDKGRIAQLENLGGHVDARLDNRHIEGDAWLTWNPVGWVDLSLDAELGGKAASLAAWKSATGSLTLSGRAHLRELATLERIGLVKKGTLPIARARGQLLVNASVERDTSERPPDLEIAVETQDLALEGASKALGREVAPWKLGGIDVRATAALIGNTGAAELELRVRDGRGPLVWLDADAELPYRELWNDAALRRRPIAEWLRQAPIVAWLSTAERRWNDLPAMLRTQDMRGRVRVSASFDGTLAEPRAAVTARTFGLEHPALPVGFPLDVVLLADWKGKHADAHLKLFAPKRQLVAAHVTLDADLAAALAGQLEPWHASASATFCDLPLDSVGRLTGRRVEGSASGELTLDDLNLPSAKLEANVRVTELRVNHVLYPSGDVELSMRDGLLDADATLRQADKGYAKARAKLPVRWKRAMPELTSERTADIRIEARKFRVAMLQPFLEKTFAELDGRVDANARLELGDPPRLSGTLVLEKGRFQLTSFGETFFDTRARLRLSRTGNLVLDRFVTHSIGGRVEAKGQARLRGLTLESARVALRIPHDRKIPVVIDGEHYGDASGRIDVSARMQGSKLRVDVDVPELRAELAASRSEPVQSLERARHVRIGVKRQGRFQVVPVGPPREARRHRAMPILLVVSLGDVRIERERELMVKLTGKTRIEIADRMRVAGRIELQGGRLDVRGRRFQIEHGSITFTGRRPDNPEIVAVASWRAPDGTKVFAQFVGPLKTGKVELRSDPPLSKEEILSLIVFGETDHGSGDAVGQAAGLGGAIVAPGLNEAIDDLTGLDVRARVGSSRTNDPTTELELVITHELSVQFAYVLGVPPPGASPDRNYGTIDWRFRHDWSLETSVGDHGSTSLDILWHHRY